MNTTATLARQDIGLGMLVDRYELTMLTSLIAEGRHRTPAVFEAFARKLPTGRRYGVYAGLGRVLDAIENLAFTPADLEYLLADGAIDDQTAEYLATFRFTGRIESYREGDLYFPHSPLLTVTAPLAEGLLLETLILSILNHDSAVASAASRMVAAADGRPVIEMGSRRTHETSAVAAARAAFIAGFTATSNAAAGRLYGIPTVGTSAHAFTLAHATEREAFASQVATHGPHTTLLVDTYDIPTGIATAVDVAGTQLGAIRIDSGDLAQVARDARAQLDQLGAVNTRIVATSDLDEYAIARLADAPIDTYGAGTRVVTGSGHPTCAMVYKLVAVADGPNGTWRNVAKASTGKRSIGGHKTAWRTHDSAGYMIGEHITVSRMPGETPHGTGRLLTHVVVENGHVLPRPTLTETREFAAAALNELRPVDKHLDPAAPAFEAQS